MRIGCRRWSYASLQRTGVLDCAFNNDGIEGDVMEMHEVSDRNSN